MEKRRKGWRAGAVALFMGSKAQKKRGDVVSRCREGDVPLSGDDAQPAVIETNAVCCTTC